MVRARATRLSTPRLPDLGRVVNSLILAQVDARLYHISAGYKLASQLSGKL